MSTKTIFYSDQSSSYLNQGKYFEAYGLLKCQYKLGPQMHFAPVLVKYFVSLMQTDRADKAEKIRDELAELLRDKFAELPNEINQYAESLMEENKLWEAILFFQISLMYCEKESSCPDPAIIPQISASGLMQCVAKIFSATPGTKKLLKQHVVCWIKKAKDLAINAIPKNKKFSSLVQANLLGHQARCFLLFQEYNVAEKLLKEAIQTLKQCHKSDAENFGNFSQFLRQLGVICFQTNRLDAAERYLKRATAAAEKAKDLKGYERDAFIQNNELLLKKIKYQKEFSAS